MPADRWLDDPEYTHGQISALIAVVASIGRTVFTPGAFPDEVRTSIGALRETLLAHSVSDAWLQGLDDAEAAFRGPDTEPRP